MIEQQVDHHKLTLLSPTARYGVTTLLAKWVRTTRLPIAGLSLSQDDDHERFLRYLLAGLEGNSP